MRELPTINEPVPMLDLAPEEVAEMAREVRRLARERDAVILAHNYQVPEVQDVAHYTGDSLGLSRQAAESGASTIAFCGVHFMAETAAILSPEKTVLIPDPDAGCSLADSITAEELRAWKAKHSPDAVVVMYVNTSAEVKAETDYCCTSSNAVKVVEHILREHGPDEDLGLGPVLAQDVLDHLDRVGGGAAVVGLGLDLGRGVDVHDDDRVGAVAGLP